MQLTDREIELVRRSFQEAMLRREPFQLDFYEEFFRRAPETRSMFRDDIAGQGMRFMNAMRAIVDNIGKDNLADRLVDLGHGHAALGVRAEHFEPMREALVATLASTIGDSYTDEIGAAWRKAFDEIAKAMVQAGSMA